MRRVLVVGGSGAFGSRLVRGLAATTELGIVIAGRSHERAEALAGAIANERPGRDVRTVSLDRGLVTAAELAALDVFAVVDAAGPFQGGDYRLARTAIAAGLHYVDLADARDFVAGFAQLDAEARRAGVVAVTGASSTPALSNAVLDALTQGWSRVDTVEIGISPGNRAPRGLSVVSAILSYAGRPVRLLLDGRWQTRPGWGLLTRRGIPGLGRRWLSLCETPDLDLVPARLSVRRSAIFRAGLELSILHLGLAAAAVPVRLGLLPTLEPLARAFRFLAGCLSRLGTDRGGMLVTAAGSDAEGRHVLARWTLVAEAGDGPIIPTLPALAVIRKLADGLLDRRGAGPCVGLLGLDDLDPEFRPYRIRTEARVELDDRPPLFARALGEAFERMPPAVRSVHRPGHWLELEGEADIDGADGLLARSIALLFRFPPKGRQVPVRVTMEAHGGAETWTRDFGGRRFKSELREVKAGGLSERFGPFTFDLEVPASEHGLTMAIAGWRLGPIRLPTMLAPRTEAREHVDEMGRFRFDVMIGLPFAGRIVRYRGWLRPAPAKTKRE
jgi:hypothetical protein